MKFLRTLSRTGTAVLNAIVLKGNRVFRGIDDEAAAELRKNPSILRVPSTRIVRQTLTMLVERGLLTYDERDNRNQDRYYPKPSLMDDWNAIQKERE